LVEFALKTQNDSIVLTDINNTTAIPEFYFNCKKIGIKPIAGVDVRDDDNKQLYILIARNNKGLAEINKFISEINIKKKPKIPIPLFNNVFVVVPFSNIELFHDEDNYFIGIKPDDLKKISTSKFQIKNDKMLVLYPVSFRNSEDYEICKHLRAIDKNILLSQLNEPTEFTPNDIFILPAKIREIYSNYPQIITNTLKLLKECNLYFDNGLKNKKVFSSSYSEDINLLRSLSINGLEKRYGSNNKTAIQRLNHELEIITKLNFVSYFLIAHDIVQFAKSKNFFHVGRGSGANSIVAYCLEITNVDPIELDLYFERFLNPKRSSPPDFDIDFSWKDRNTVISYIFNKYGFNRTALLGAINTFQPRSILRELGKIYGLPKEEIDVLTSNPASVANKDFIHKKIINIASKLTDFPNLRTIHAGGIIISDDPIFNYAALDFPPKGFPTTQWDMYVAEELGFEKFDILSQRGLGHIKDCVKIVQKNKNINININDVNKFKFDNRINQKLSTGETLGCFYIESPAMRGLLKKLRCDNYLTLVAASSIIRPGVAKSGMMKRYIERYNNPNDFEYLHPIMKEQLSETYGIMVYQEDVLKICHHYAGMDLADADVLRRAMSGKFRSRKEFDKIKDKFFELCNKNNRPQNVSTELWRQIESFAGYSFSKAHSASYAVESYQSLFLKTYFPIEFMVSVINNFGGFYSSWVYFHEAKRSGATINLPCINNSEYLTSVKGTEIFIGFIHVKNLEENIVSQILLERNLYGKFTDLHNFMERCAIPDEQLNILIKCGAFDFTGKSRPELMWEKLFVKNQSASELLLKQKKLFSSSPNQLKLPVLQQSELEKAYDEIELLDFPVSLSLFDMLQTKFRGEVFFKNMIKFSGKEVRMLGQFITLKYVRTSDLKIMNFITWIDYEGNFFDSVHFPDSLKEYPFKGNGIYLLLGIVDVEFGYPILRVKKMAKLPLKPDPRE
jgi:DNA-directed DNA polymerase III PolC